MCALLTTSYTYHSVSWPLYLCCQVSENIRAVSIKKQNKTKNLCCSSDPTVQDLQRETPKWLVTLPEVLTFFDFQRTIFFILSPLTVYRVFVSNVVSNHLIIFSQTHNELKWFLIPFMFLPHCTPKADLSVNSECRQLLRFPSLVSRILNKLNLTMKLHFTYAKISSTH